MERTQARFTSLPLWRHAGNWLILAILTFFLARPTAPTLFLQWRSDPRSSHGPLVVVVALTLLWLRRGELRQASRASGLGLAMMALSGLGYVGAIWVDIAFLKALMLITLAFGGIWFSCGHRAAHAAAGPFGLICFSLPWPTTVIERIAFPLQLASSSYAALFGGLLGLPIRRDGVHLHIVPNPDQPPIYSAFVAEQCSGLASLLVLLALGYLFAYYTPTHFLRRALLVAVIVPLALFTNAIRLTLVLIAGTYYGPKSAQWIHDHEAPVLIFLCSLGLLALRNLLLSYSSNHLKQGNPNTDEFTKNINDTPLSGAA